MEALTALTHGLLPNMIAKGEGRIINIASTAAFQPGPFMSVYFATKAYVLSLSEGLRHELAGTGVTVTTHCPGPTESAFAAEAGNDKTMLFKRGAVATSHEVALDTYHAMEKGKGLLYMGLPGGWERFWFPLFYDGSRSVWPQARFPCSRE